MRGGIQKKGNNYYAVVYDGIDPGTGRMSFTGAMGTRDLWLTFLRRPIPRRPSTD